MSFKVRQEYQEWRRDASDGVLSQSSRVRNAQQVKAPTWSVFLVAWPAWASTTSYEAAARCGLYGRVSFRRRG